MTRQQAKDLLPVITAFAEGKDIQIVGVKGWITTDHILAFDADPSAYRIKPEPREFWLVIWHNTSISVYKSFISHQNAKEVIHVREVISEEE